MAPLGVLAVIAAVLSMLAYSRRPAKSFRVNVQFIVSLATWALLWFATASSFAKEGMTSLPIHMIGHILVMFVVPMGIVGSSYVRSLWWLFGAPKRRRLLSWWYLRRSWHAPRWLFHPFVAAIVMNVVMVAAHLSSVFDFMMSRSWAMDWLMEPAFLLSGLFFFHFIIPSLPRKSHVRARFQLAMIILTMAVMLILAMAMSIFTKDSWYTVMVMHPGMAAMPGMATSASVAFDQQRLAAAILWICGDVWAIPCLVLIVRRVIARDGSLFAALEKQTSRLTGVAS
jgi:cytochrome c oxidase assembly factor CtaG